MRYYLLIIRFLIIPLLFSYSYSQTVVNYVDYHNTINEIEVFIRKQSYKQAISLYEQLRCNYPDFFPKDLHNLSICYLKTSQLDSAVSIAHKLVLHGRTLNEFSLYKEFRSISEEPEWISFIKNYPNLRTQYEKDLDYQLFDLINLAINPDQNVQNNTDEIRDSVYYFQGKSLFDYMFRNGFPNLFKIEEPEVEMQLLVMLRHFFYLYSAERKNSESMDNKPYSEMVFDKPYDDFLINAVYEGKLLPIAYEKIRYMGTNQSPYGFLGIRFDFDTETVSLDFGPQNSNYQEINARRKAIGLFQVDSTAGNLEGTWYQQVSFNEMKEAYFNCDTCKTFKDYSRLSSNIRYKVRKSFRNEELESFKFTYDPNDINTFHMAGSLNYMPNLRKEKSETL